MPGREPISSLANMEALESQTERIVGLVRNIQAAIDGVRPLFENYRKSSGPKPEEDADALAESLKRVAAVQKALDQERSKGLTLETELAKQIAIQREINKQKQSDMRAEAKDAAGLNDAYRKLELQYNQAQRAAKNLAATPGTPQGAIDEANKKALALSNQLKTIDAAVGQHQRKVGDYVGAISILDKSLNEVKQKLDQMTKAGQGNSAQAEALRQEYELLSTLLNQQTKGFTSLGMQIRATEKALLTMKAAGLEGTEGFEQLQLSLAHAQREMHDFREEQALLKADVPALAALTTVAKGLGGAYAFAAGSAALFANGDEKIEKELNKLVAIMTVLQGLNELHELIEKKGAIATLINAGAQKLKNFVLTGSVTGIKAATAATVQNTEAQAVNTAAAEANVVAEGEAAVAAEEQAAAQTEVTAAVEGSTLAMQGLRVALIATGIGALLVLLPLIAEGMSKWMNGTKEETEAQKKLNEAIKDFNDALVRSNESLRAALDEQKKELENELKVAEIKARNINDEIRLSAKKKEIAELDRKNAAETLKDLGLTRVGVDRLDLAYDQLHEKITALKELQVKYAASKDNKSMEINKETIDAMEAEAEAMKVKLEQGKKLVEQYDAANQSLKELTANDEKFAHELYERKIAALVEIENLKRGQMILDSQIISDNKFSPEQSRLRALNEEADLQKQMIEAKRDQELRNEKLTVDERKLIRLKAEQDLLHMEQDTSLKRQMIHADALLQMGHDEAMTQAELKDAWDKHVKMLSDNLKKLGDARKAFGEESKASQLKSLDEMTLAGRLKGIQHGSTKPEEDYQKKREKLEYETDMLILNDRLRTLQELISFGRKMGQDVTQLEAEQAQIRMQMADKEAAHKIKVAKDGAAERKKLHDAETQLAKEVEGTVAGFIEGAQEREINRLQVAINKNNELKDSETARISSSTLSEQQKAAQLQIIQAKTQAQNEILTRQENRAKEKQARFERDKAVFDILANTAKAITEAVAASPLTGGMPFSAIAAAVGAAQLATVLSRPIPKFASGTASSPEGWALTDERGPELYRTPSGNVFMGNNKPTLRYLEKGTEIIPHDELNRMMYASMLRDTVAIAMPARQDETAKELKRQNGIIQQQTEELKKAYSDQQVNIRFKDLPKDWKAYIDKSVRR